MQVAICAGSLPIVVTGNPPMRNVRMLVTAVAHRGMTGNHTSQFQWARHLRRQVAGSPANAYYSSEACNLVQVTPAPKFQSFNMFMTQELGLRCIRGFQHFRDGLALQACAKA